MYVSSEDGHLYAVDALTGKQRSRTTSRLHIAEEYKIVPHAIRSAPKVDNGVVYFGSEDGFFYAVQIP